jgi:glycosyltransferase involved in cell wall biosynthesis
MKIGIDISQIVYDTGVSAYTKELVKALVTLDVENKYLLFGGSARLMSVLNAFVDPFGGRVEKKILPIPPTLSDLLFNTLRFPPIETFIGQVDVFHSSDWTQPKSNAKKVTTVHDLAPLKFPRETHPRIVAVHRRRLEIVRREVDLVIVPSDATRDDLIAYGVEEERIRVIPEAPTIVKSKSTLNEIEAIKKKYKIDGQYLVTVGVGKRKNTEKLIKAFENIRAGKNLKLVLLGRNNLGYPEERGLRFTGHVSDQEFSALVSGAEVLVYPSLYEGFGLPILEGFAAGVPVVTSNVSSLPQVAGEGAILVDPYEVSSISEGIKEALKNPKLLIQKGSKRLQDFSWEATAKMTLAVYNEL